MRTPAELVFRNIIFTEHLVVAVVTGLPVVPQEKHEKLTAVVTKVLSQWGPVREGGQFAASTGQWVGGSDMPW